MSIKPQTAFVHIGAPKTGTTAIQVAFSYARGPLLKLGFHYLAGDRNHSERLAVAFWDEKDAVRLGNLRWISEPRAFQAYRETTLAELHQELEDAVPNDIVISGEELCSFSPSEVRRFLAFLRMHVDCIKVIAYAREPAHWISSAAQQGAKWSGDVLQRTFVAPRLPHFRKRFEGFRAAVGPENFVLRAYSDGNPDFDVVSDFAALLGVSEAFRASTTQTPVNRAVSHRSAVLFSALNDTAPPFINGFPNPFRAFGFSRDARLPGRAFELPSETMEGLSETLCQERGWIHEVLGQSVFVEPPLPSIGLDDWFEDERDELHAFALTLAARMASAQNELALKSLLRAKAASNSDLGLAFKLLTDASNLSADRWSLHLIATEAAKVDHPERHKMFAKQRLMRDIEEGDGSLPDFETMNPFDRTWLLPAKMNDTSELTQVLSTKSKTEAHAAADSASFV